MNMDSIWANRLIAGTQKWADCRDTRKASVKAELTARVNSGAITAEKFAEIIGSTPATPTLEDVQAQQIAESKTKLAEYLESHPLTWTDGKQYSVTEDKQALLTGNLAAYQLAVTLGQANPELTWNATGEECTVWTFENLAMLAIAIKAYVKPLVANQQKIEIAIRACTTVEAVEAVTIDYEAVS
ncbi:hypothetical protein OBV_22700 [Oscillibacter valericigenes Sjm18-20]|nr:hypothetical protein OBV_22700 [Oscillibacter valericigenes Sjm18-20]